MNMFKKNGGFTLVELIVVIAILAILAGIAIPAYSGYITKAQQAGDLQVLASVNTAVQGLAIAEGAEVTAITVDAEGNVEVTADKTVEFDENDIEDLTGDLGESFSDAFNGATWSEDGWELTPATTATTPSETQDPAGN